MASDDDRKGSELGPSGLPPVTREVEVVRTYLSLLSADHLKPVRSPAVEAEMVELTSCSVARWRELYAEIGGAWHWHDRDVWPDEQIAARLAQPNVRVFTVHAVLNGERFETAGFVELERADDGAVEIVYFGVHAKAMGRGLGAWLLAQTVGVAFAWNASRVWLHTCTLDSPVALPNYQARGFAIEKTERYTTHIAI